LRVSFPSSHSCIKKRDEDLSKNHFCIIFSTRVSEIINKKIKKLIFLRASSTKYRKREKIMSIGSLFVQYTNQGYLKILIFNFFTFILFIIKAFFWQIIFCFISFLVNKSWVIVGCLISFLQAAFSFRKQGIILTLKKLIKVFFIVKQRTIFNYSKNQDTGQ
jgi:hypothetical protein